MGLILRRRIVFLFAGLSLCAFGGRVAPGESLRSPSKDSPARRPASLSTAHSSDVQAPNYIIIPGPLRSFLRMGGISAKAEPDEVLPLLGHFVDTYGYEGSKAKSARPTEALILFKRYFAQAKALAATAGPSATLQFSTCDESKPLLAILGYRLKNGCAQNLSIDVGDAEKAFITVDSGFPLADVEQALFEHRAFSVSYPSVRLPLMYTKQDWIGRENGEDTDVIDTLADHPTVSRLYWGLSNIDEEARDELRRSLGMRKLVSMATVLDFYGSSLAIRGGRVAVPGGRQAEAAWKSLAGADPSDPGQFMSRLLQKDNGRLAEFYDSIARAPSPQLTYLTSGEHLQHFYAAFYSKDTSRDALRSVFRPSGSLLLLVTRLPLGENGEPLVPGNLSVWKDTFRGKSHSHIEANWAQRARNWTTPEQLVQGLFAASRSPATNGPLEMYMSLSEIDRGRRAGRHISPDTARLLVAHFKSLRDHYGIFSEFAGLNDASIGQFVKMTEKIDRIRDPLLRADMMGIFEANIGLWQILARQGQIPSADLNESWQRTIKPFGAASNSARLFDAGRASLAELVKTVARNTEISQQEIIDLLAGPEQSTSDGRQVHARIAAKIRQVLTDQRLVSLDTLLELDDFAKMAHSSDIDTQRRSALAEELEEARSPRAMFTEAERAEWTPGHEPNRHILLEMKPDLRKSFRASPQLGESARGALTPFLRDTLVGLNYAFYEPPGAQILHSRPLLVRAHDFLASERTEEGGVWLSPQLVGAGLTAADGVHLSGSLAGLPYALAEIEQDFIVPQNVQALIWHETTAGLLVSSVVPRWWSTSQQSLHAAALYQKAGEELITGAAKDPNLRTAVTDILSNRLPVETTDRVKEELGQTRAQEALSRIAPADAFYLGAEFEKRFPGRMAAWGPAGAELASLIQRDPEQVNPERLSHEFGVPHPILAQSYRDEMLNLKPLPSVMDYASELLAESWESTNLYWARLADEMGYTPAMLNELAPMLTRRMAEKIFASDFDDWPALIRALREAGDEFRRTPKMSAAALQLAAPAN